MLLPGTGILITSMQVLPEEDADFNVWFDKEHLPERVEISGFLDGRRYESTNGSGRYLQIYNTVDAAVLNSAAYHKVLDNQTAWSKHHIPRFIRPTRVVGQLVESRGYARGAAVTLIRLRPTPGARMLPALHGFLGLLDQAGVTSVHFVEGDAELSKPLMTNVPYVGSEDSYIIVETSNIADGEKIGEGISEHVATQSALSLSAYGELIDVATYRYRLDISAPVRS